MPTANSTPTAFHTPGGEATIMALFALIGGTVQVIPGSPWREASTVAVANGTR